MKTTASFSGLGPLVLAALAAPASASTPGSHLWVVNEIFSNADGTVQFVELKECCGSPFEHELARKDVFSETRNFTFPENIHPAEDTSNRHILLATAAFAALPGAPTPDHILPENFFSVDSDVLRWHIYPNATLTFRSGDLPLDGVLSLNQDLTTAPNSPTNFLGHTGSVNVIGSASCFGVGCPCANDDPDAGCANSTGSGGLLSGSGTTSVAADDAVLTGTGLPPMNNGLFYMGDTLVQNAFFDGFQCGLGTTFRFLGSIQNTGAAGTMTLGPGIIADSGSLITAGSTWHFHAWHRDVPGSPCGTGANLTNVFSVTFSP